MLFRRSRERHDELPDPVSPEETNTFATNELKQDWRRDGTSRIYAPPNSDQASAASSSEHAHRALPLTAGKLFGLRILLAEDHQVNANLMIEELEHLGAQVEHALDGEAACLIFMTGAGFDVVLMDCQMPSVDGFEAARRIRTWEAKQGRQATPIIAMTGLSHEFEHDHSSQAGMDHYLVKPFHSDQFAAVILMATASRRAEKIG